MQFSVVVRCRKRSRASTFWVLCPCVGVVQLKLLSEIHRFWSDLLIKRANLLIPTTERCLTPMNMLRSTVRLFMPTFTHFCLLLNESVWKGCGIHSCVEIRRKTPFDCEINANTLSRSCHSWSSIHTSNLLRHCDSYDCSETQVYSSFAPAKRAHFQIHNLVISQWAVGLQTCISSL